MPSFSRIFAAVFGCFSSKPLRDEEPVKAIRPVKVYAGASPSTPSTTSTTSTSTTTTSSPARSRRDSANFSSPAVADTTTSTTPTTSTKKEVKISPNIPQRWEYKQKDYREVASTVPLERFWQAEPEPAMRTEKEIHHDLKWYGGLHRAENSMRLKTPVKRRRVDVEEEEVVYHFNF